MNRTTWLMAILALTTAFLVGRVLDRARTQRPRELLASADRHLNEAQPNFDQALYELNLALDLLGPGEDVELERSLLEARATAEERRGILQAALRDLRRLISMEPDNEDDLRQRMARLELDSKHYAGVEKAVAPILERIPWHTGAKLMLGLSAKQRSDEAFQELLDRLRVSLPPKYFTEAEALARKARATDSESRARGAVMAELQTLLESELGPPGNDLLTGLENAAIPLAEARHYFVESLAGYAHPEAATSLGQLLLDADLPDVAADVELAASAQKQVQNSLPAQLVLARALWEMGRPEAASKVIERALPNQRELDTGLRLEKDWSEILYEIQDWPRLALIAQLIVRRASNQTVPIADREAAAYYLGRANFMVGNFAGAESAYRGFARSEIHEPHPGTLAQAYLDMGSIAGQRDDGASELSWYREAVAIAPRASANAWLRIAQLQHNLAGSSVEALNSLAQAMATDPALESEHFQQFLDWGAEYLAARAMDLELQASFLPRQGRAYPTDSTEVFVLFELARIYHGRGESSASHRCLDRLLSLVPGFGPALDLRAEEYRGQNLPTELAQTLLERVERGGQLGPLQNELRELQSQGVLSASQRYTLLELDAGGMGTLTFARQSIDRGRPDLALRGLEPRLKPRQATEDQSPLAGALRDEALCLAAEAELALSRPLRASLRVKEVPADSPSAAHAFRLGIEAALALEKTESIGELVRTGIEQGSLDRNQSIDLADLLILRGLLGPARTLAEALDQRAEFRGGPTTLRLAVVALLLGDGAAAAEAFDRAEAWYNDGTPALGRLLLACETAGWVEFPGLVRAVRVELEPLDSLTSCILSALEERLDEARQLAIDGELAHPEEPLWSFLRLAIDSLAAKPLIAAPRLGENAALETLAFLRGSKERPRDPRQALLELLCLERPAFANFFRVLLERSTPESSLWKDYLLARNDLALGKQQAALEASAALNVHHPTFQPAWDLRRSLLIQELGRIDHPDLIALDAERAQVGAGASLAGTEGCAALLAEALARSRAGNLDEALKTCQQAVDRFPDNALSHWFFASLLSDRGSWPAALVQARRFAELADDQALGWQVPEYLELLWGAHGAQRLDDPGLLVELESLARRLPEDPLIAASQARFQLVTHPQSLRIGIQRAWRRLSEFRTVTQYRPLDALRSGASSAWLELYFEYDPQEGEQLVRGELERRPEDLELWLQLGRCFEAEGRWTEALTQYDKIRRMVPDSRAIQRTAEILSSLGTDHARLLRELDLLSTIDNLPPDAPLPRYLRARSLVVGRQRTPENGFEILSQLWDEREQIQEQVPIPELALVYGSALLRRGERQDQAKIEQVLSVALEAEADPLRHDGIAAQINLSRWLQQN